MNKKISRILVSTLLLATFSFISFKYETSQAGENFVFTGWESEPFYYNSAHGIQGAFFDIMTEICRLEKLRCTFKIAGFRDAMEKLKTGESQGGGPFIFTYPRSTVLSFSSQIFSSTYGFFALPKTAAKIKTYDDLRGLTIGVMELSGSRVSLESVKEFVDGKLQISEEKGVSDVMHKIERKKYPLGYTNRDSALNWISKNHSSVIEVPELGENLEYRLAFSQKGLKPEVTRRILTSFKELRKSGFIDGVAKKYKLTLATEGK